MTGVRGVRGVRFGGALDVIGLERRSEISLSSPALKVHAPLVHREKSPLHTSSAKPNSCKHGHIEPFAKESKRAGLVSGSLFTFQPFRLVFENSPVHSPMRDDANKLLNEFWEHTVHEIQISA